MVQKSFLTIGNLLILIVAISSGATAHQILLQGKRSRSVQRLNRIRSWRALRQCFEQETYSVPHEDQNTNPAAADILRVCALLEADDIPEEIFQTGAAELGHNIADAALSLVKLMAAIKDAGRFSLLQRNPESRTLRIHRLVIYLLDITLPLARLQLVTLPDLKLSSVWMSEQLP